MFYAVMAVAASSCLAQSDKSENSDRWAIRSDGSIVWRIDDRLPHHDHIEMSGERVSIWIEYGVMEDRSGAFRRTIVFPTFRMKPNDTHASLMYTFDDNDLPRIFVDNVPLRSTIVNGRSLPAAMHRIDSITHKGIMTVYSTIGSPAKIRVERRIFPSVDKPLAVERLIFTNVTNQEVVVDMDRLQHKLEIDTSRTTRGPHIIAMTTFGHGRHRIPPGGRAECAIYYQASTGQSDLATPDPHREEDARSARIAKILSLMRLETPEMILNTAFDFAKIRAVESIYKTRGGYMHSPGGLAYYAAIWANDQAEYVNPFFAMLTDKVANSSAMNSYRHFARYINSEYKPIPSSIIAEGEGYWNGVGDRGDMAMIAYGAARYALALGSYDSAKVLWPLITWCLEYCKRHINADGVVESDTDELEGRFPAGKANLSTSSLYYDALLSSAMLGKALGESSRLIRDYERRAARLRKAIENYFGSNVEGFETYKYYKENDVLRSWICLPLCVGIFDRKDQTIDALFSPRLWTGDGLATQAGDKTFWDRSTLYALRGVLQAGETRRAMEYISYYSRRRLLGDHVPYPVEAFPEGNQRHLSAESGLYCRIFTEGLFGIRPTGINSFTCTPRLPAEWNRMALRHIQCAGKVFDIEVACIEQGRLSIIIQGDDRKQFEVDEGGTVSVRF
ncbi:MAG TPA: hypothetical protein VF191_09945 [Cyclobacteriaceae bacterium]